MQPGSRVGQYVLERRLGEGAVTEVWLGRNARTDALAAIRFLRNGYAQDPELRQRFLIETRRQEGLHHPNIVKVFGFEQLDGHVFAILQYIDGESLAGRLSRIGRLDAGDLIRIAAPILNALDYAREYGILHLDLKPSNILLDRNGTPFLSDFRMRVLTVASRRTARGDEAGTSLYLSPEQIKDTSSVDGRSDIYSFGCILYETLTGAAPFTGDLAASDFSIKMAHVQSEPAPLRLRNPSISPALESVVLRCLAKNPDDRFPTSGELRDALLGEVNVSYRSAPTAVGLPQTSPPPQHYPTPVSYAMPPPSASRHRWMPSIDFSPMFGARERATPITETPVLHQLTLDLAVKDIVPVYKPMELAALIRLPDSPALGDLLGADRDTRLSATDVRTRNLELEFPGNRPIDILLRVTSPDFKPKRQQRTVRVYPGRDCEIQRFLITPQHTGELNIEFDLLYAGISVASRLLRTTAEPSDRVLQDAPPSLVTVPITVTVVRRRPRWPRIIAIAAGAAAACAGMIALAIFLHKPHDGLGDVPRGVFTSSHRTSFANEQKLALVVGIGDYPQESGWTRLKFPASDAVAVGEELKRNSYLTTVLTNERASKRSITEWLGALGQGAGHQEATIVFYFAGHGVQQNGEQYLITYGIGPENIAGEALALGEIRSKLDSAGVARKLLFLDACRVQANGARGSFGDFARLKDLSTASGIYVLNGTAPNQYSYEYDALQHGMFTCALLNGLEGDAIDARDGAMSFADLFNTIKQEMALLSLKLNQRQQPWESGESNGDMLISVVPPKGHDRACPVR